MQISKDLRFGEDHSRTVVLILGICPVALIEKVDGASR